MRKEKLLIIILFLLCSFNLFVNFDSEVEAKEPVLPDGIYYIKNYNSQKYMDVYEQSTNNGSNVHQWDFHGGLSQQWLIKNLGYYYSIIPMHAEDKALDVYNGEAINNANIQIWDVNLTNAQQWDIVECGNGTFKIASRCDVRKVIDVEGISNSNGANIHLYDWVNGANQKWYFEKLEYIPLNTKITKSISAGMDYIFSYNPTDSRMYVAETTGSTDTYMYVNNTQNIYTDDDSGIGNNSCIGFNAIAANKTIYIRVRHYSTTGTGAFTFQLRRQRAQVYTFDYGDGVDTTPFASGALNRLNAMGYESNYWHNSNQYHITDYDSTGYTRLNSEVVFFAGHGLTNGGGVKFKDKEFLSKDLINMNNCKLAVWATCNSASFAEQSQLKGARTAIGWNKLLDQNAGRKWTDQLFIELANHKTVKNAAESASRVSLWPWDGTFDGWEIFGNKDAVISNPRVNTRNIMIPNIVSQNEFENFKNEFDYTQYDLPGGGVRYYKTINGLLTNDYYDVLNDGTQIIKSSSNISAQDIENANQQQLVKSNNHVENNITADGINFNIILKTEEHVVYMKINNQMIPIQMIYTDYTNDLGIVYQDVICTNLLDNTTIDYGDVCASN